MKTPVWFAAEPSVILDSHAVKLYVYAIGVSAKVKRIRNNPRVSRSLRQARRVPARAEILAGTGAQHGMQLLNKKYTPWKQLLDFFAKFPNPSAPFF